MLVKVGINAHGKNLAEVKAGAKFLNRELNEQGAGYTERHGT